MNLHSSLTVARRAWLDLIDDLRMVGLWAVLSIVAAIVLGLLIAALAETPAFGWLYDLPTPTWRVLFGGGIALITAAIAIGTMLFGISVSNVRDDMRREKQRQQASCR